MITLLVLLFGEIFPKTVATRYAESIALNVSGFYVILGKILYPVVFIIDKIMQSIQPKKAVTHVVTDEELEAFIDQ